MVQPYSFYQVGKHSMSTNKFGIYHRAVMLVLGLCLSTETKYLALSWDLLD